MSRLSSFLSRLFSPSQEPESAPRARPEVTHTYHDKPRAKEPSKYDCLAKGIARSWIEGKGWKVERSKVKTKQEGASSWIGGEQPMYNRECHDVILTNQDLDIKMTLEEGGGTLNDYHALSRLLVEVHGTLTIRDYQHYGHASDPDAQYLMKVIRENPYPALKPIVKAYEAKQIRLKREEEHKKARADRAIKAIEELGCSGAL